MMDFSGCSSGGLSIFQNVRFPVVLRYFGQSFYCPSEVRLADKRSERPLRTRLSRLLMALPPRIFLVGIHHDRQPILWDPVYLYADGPKVAKICRGGNAIENPQGKIVAPYSFGLKHPDACNHAGVENFKRKKTHEKNLI